MLFSTISDQGIVQWFNSLGGGEFGLAYGNIFGIASQKPDVTSADQVIDVPFSSFVCFGRIIPVYRLSVRSLYHTFVMAATSISADTCLINAQITVARFLTESNFVGLLTWIAATQRGTVFTGSGYVVRDPESLAFISQRFRAIVGRSPTQQEIDTAFPSGSTGTPIVVITQPESVESSSTTQQNIQELVTTQGATVQVSLEEGLTPLGGIASIEPGSPLESGIKAVTDLFIPTPTPTPQAQPSTNLLLLLIAGAAAYGIFEFFRRRRR